MKEIENKIDITESNDKIIAIISGSKAIEFELRLKENVLWSDSNGHLGAFLTNQRFFVISTASSSWQSMSLKLDESEKGTASLSPYIALLVTPDRAIAFDARSNRFSEVQLPLHDELLAAEVDKYVAIVITNSRAFGISLKSPDFTEIPFRLGESVEKINITSSKATVQTSDRLLTFGAKTSTWIEHRLN